MPEKCPRETIRLRRITGVQQEIIFHAMAQKRKKTLETRETIIDVVHFSFYQKRAFWETKNSKELALGTQYFIAHGHLHVPSFSAAKLQSLYLPPTSDVE